MQKVVTNDPCNNFGRLFLIPIDPYCGLELEISKVESGLRMYINVFSLEIKPETPKQNTVPVEVTISEETRTYKAFIYQGGQRLLLPSEARDWIADALIDCGIVSISVSRYHADIIPDGFAESYDQLIKIPVN